MIQPTQQPVFVHTLNERGYSTMRREKGSLLVGLAVLAGLLAVLLLSLPSTVQAVTCDWVTMFPFQLQVLFNGAPAIGNGNVVVQNRQTLQIWQGKTGANGIYQTCVPIGYYNYRTWIDGDQSQYECVARCSLFNFYIGDLGFASNAQWQTKSTPTPTPILATPTATPTPKR